MNYRVLGIIVVIVITTGAALWLFQPQATEEAFSSLPGETRQESEITKSAEKSNTFPPQTQEYRTFFVDSQINGVPSFEISYPAEFGEPVVSVEPANPNTN